jgi:hypothetical protein
MTLAELANRLRRAGVPDGFYVLDGGLGAGECVGIEQRADDWWVYYSERGAKRALDTCPNEASACRAMLRHVARMMRQAGMGNIPADTE